MQHDATGYRTPLRQRDLSDPQLTLLEQILLASVLDHGAAESGTWLDWADQLRVVQAMLDTFDAETTVIRAEQAVRLGVVDIESEQQMSEAGLDRLMRDLLGEDEGRTGL